MQQQKQELFFLALSYILWVLVWFFISFATLELTYFKEYIEIVNRYSDSIIDCYKD